jgi:PAS domain S-box-containing protein
LLILSLFFIGVFLYIISFQITRPIRFSIKTIEQLSLGNYDIKFSFKSKSYELNALIEKFKTLTLNLINERKKNLELNYSLENKVKSRTNDLEKALIKLEKSQFLARTILNNGLDAVIAANHKGEIIEWNKKATEIFGYETNEALGKKISDLIIPDHLVNNHINGMQRYNNSKQSNVVNKKIEIDAKTKSGKQICIELFVVHLNVGNSSIFSSIIRDITESKMLNEQLEKQRLLNIKILDSLPLNITLKTKQGKYQIVNNFYLNNLNIKKEQIVGKTDYDLFEKKQAEELVKNDTEYWDGDKKGVCEESHFING